MGTLLLLPQATWAMIEVESVPVVGDCPVPPDGGMVDGLVAPQMAVVGHLLFLSRLPPPSLTTLSVILLLVSTNTPDEGTAPTTSCNVGRGRGPPGGRGRVSARGGRVTHPTRGREGGGHSGPSDGSGRSLTPSLSSSYPPSHTLSVILLLACLLISTNTPDEGTAPTTSSNVGRGCGPADDRGRFGARGGRVTHPTQGMEGEGHSGPSDGSGRSLTLSFSSSYSPSPHCLSFSYSHAYSYPLTLQMRGLLLLPHAMWAGAVDQQVIKVDSVPRVGV